MKNMIRHIVLSFLFVTCNAEDVFSFTDSTQSVKTRRSNLKFTVRIHNCGLFNYSGRISSTNPAVDGNITYDRKGWGFMNFTAMDIRNQYSDNNFSLSLFYKRIRLGRFITVTPHTGVGVEKWGKDIGDRQIIITAAKVNRWITVDHTMLFSNVWMEHQWLDWVNRMRVLYTYDSHVNFTFSMWHNNKVFDSSGYLSYGANVTYSHIKVSNAVSLSMGITTLLMATTSDEQEFPKRNGIVFTVASVID